MYTFSKVGILYSVFYSQEEMMRARDDTSTSEGQESGYLKIGFWIFWKNMFLGAS